MLLAILMSAIFAAQVDVAGSWTLTLDRPNWQPRTDRAALTLTKDGRSWRGSLRFRTILYAREHALTDVAVDGGAVRFRIAHSEFQLSFEGELKDGEITGTCDWKDLGRFPFTAKRAASGPIERFEPGSSFTGYFPKGDAEALGLDGKALDELVREASETDTDALLILKDGRVVCERYFGGPAEPIHIMSVTKFVVAMAIALLLDEQKIASLDTPVREWFPEWDQDLKSKVTLRHLMTHTSGIEHRPMATLLNQQSDKVAFVLQSPVVDEPGTKYAYSNEAVALLSGIIAEAAGQPVDEYLSARLFTPLGIKSWSWDRDGAENPITYAQLALTGRDLARIGQVVVDGGKCQGRQILSTKSIALLSTQATPLARSQGLLWFLYHDDQGQKVIGCGHTGWLGQYLAVYPAARLVGVRLRRYKESAEAENAGYELGSFPSLVRKLKR